jgi:hypothetical protein
MMTDSFVIRTGFRKGQMAIFIEISVNEFMIERFGSVDYWTFIDIFGGVVERVFLFIKNGVSEFIIHYNKINSIKSIT